MQPDEAKAFLSQLDEIRHRLDRDDASSLARSDDLDAVLVWLRELVLVLARKVE